MLNDNEQSTISDHLILAITRRGRTKCFPIAFGFSVLQIPATILELTGVLPNPTPMPVWYSFSRMGIALLEVGIAVWMVQIYRQYGVWAMGKRKQVSTNR